LNEEEILKADMLALFSILPDYKEKVDVQALLNIAFKTFTFSNTLVEQFDTEYSRRPVQEIKDVTQ